MKLQFNFHKPKSYYAWVGAFFAFWFAIYLFFSNTIEQMDYQWRWNEVSRYLSYSDIKHERRAEITGSIVNIKNNGEKSIIIVQEDGGGSTEKYEVYTSGLRVSKGDNVYSGDVVAVHTTSEPGLLLQGLWTTFTISFWATILSIIIGILGGLSRVSSNPALNWSSSLYVELVRGSPLLVQILLWYFVVGQIIGSLFESMGMEAISSYGWAIIALSAFNGAYITEIVRGGIESIHRGQMEAARSLGMSYPKAMIHIILPQALRRILPPLTGQFLNLIKDSSLLGVIAVRDVTKATREIVSSTLISFEFFITLGFLYLLVALPLSIFVRYLEKKAKTR